MSAWLGITGGSAGGLAIGAAGAAPEAAAPEVGTAALTGAGGASSGAASARAPSRSSVGARTRMRLDDAPGRPGAGPGPSTPRYLRNGFSRRMVSPRSAPTDTPMTFTPTSSSTRFTYARAFTGRPSQDRRWPIFSDKP